ncbi:glycosyltransferase family 4 protein [Thiorhodococcus drewsii]|nr:glycosyltransferase family 4 protein [Thiorhodococcus drewsii]
MRILYHHRTASTDGQAVHINEIIGSLRALGNEVVVVAPTASGPESIGTSQGWVDWLKLRLPHRLYELLELGYSLIAYRKLAQAIRATRPDAIYERYSLFLLAGIWAQRRFKLPLLLEVNSPLAEERATHDGLANRWLAKRLEHFVWRRADAVLPVTQVLADQIAAAGVPPERIHVIPNGINVAHFADAPSTPAAKQHLGLDGRTVLGFTGFIRDWHRLDRILDWMAQQHQSHPELHLLVVGDGPARADLEARAKRLGLTHNTTFTGIVPREHIPAQVQAFDIALQPAVVPYASPLKLVEYLALGRAIIAPKQPNLEEVLVSGHNALLFDPAIPGDWEAKLSQLLADPDLRAHLGQGARDTIQARGLTWNHNAERIVALLEQLQRSQERPRIDTATPTARPTDASS